LNDNIGKMNLDEYVNSSEEEEEKEVLIGVNGCEKTTLDKMCPQHPRTGERNVMCVMKHNVLERTSDVQKIEEEKEDDEETNWSSEEEEEKITKKERGI